MRHRLRVSVSLLVAAIPGACAATPAPPVLQPFTAIARFLPVGLDSVAFAAMPGAITGEPDDARVRWALAGSRFDPPLDLGVGRFHGVIVTEYRPGTRPADVPLPERDPDTVVAGAPLWREAMPGTRTDEPPWFAWVDGRFLVWSFERALLDAALQRGTLLGDLLAPFPRLDLVPADATHVVAVLPRPQDRSHWGRPVPDQPIVAWMQSAPPRLALAHARPLPDGWLVFAGGYAVAPATTRTVGSWQVSQHELAAGSEPMFELFAFVLAGFVVFI